MLPNDIFKRGAVYPDFPDFYQPVPYEGWFDIGSDEGHLTRNVPVMSVEEGYVESTVDATFGKEGPFCTLSSFRARGEMSLSTVYGFYIIYGLARWGLKLPYPSFGHAKLFPEQPKVECALVKLTASHKIISPKISITIKTAEEINVHDYRPQ